MSVRKIIRVDNVGKFRSLATSGDVQFRKFTLIYGANGYGKSTLAAILRSLARSDSNYILERTSAGVDTPPLIEVLTDEGVVRFSDGTWSGTDRTIEAFDETFVTENVYTGNCVEQSHRRNLYEVVVGEEAVQAAQEINAIDAKSRSAAAELREIESKLKEFSGREYALAEFLELPVVEDSQSALDVLRGQVKRAHQAELLRQRQEPVRLTLPTAPAGIGELVGAAIELTAPEVVEQVQAHISANMRGPSAEGWLRGGLEQLHGDSCPFCGQGATTVRLFELYRSYFSREYRDQVTAVRAALNGVAASYRDDALKQRTSGLRQNAELMKQWQTEVKAELLSMEEDVLCAVWLELRSAAVELLERKLENPAESVRDTERLGRALERFADVGAELEKYNLAVVEVGAEIRDVKESVGQSTIPELERRIRHVEASVLRHSDEVQALEKAMSSARAKKGELEVRKKAKKDDLTTLVSRLLREHEASINKYLARFGATFRVVKTAPSFRGGKASSDYKIEINKVPIALGDKKTPPGKACFRTTLSAGDRSTLALAFFLSRLDRDPNISNKVVELDDPFSSMDRFRLACTQQEISRLCGRTSQVVVLSHDPFFLKRLVDRAVAADVKILQLRHDGERSMLLEWNIDAETLPADQQDFFILCRFADGDHPPGSDVRSVVRAIRPFLEGHLRRTFPRQWGAKKWLGDMIAAIREAEEGSALAGYTRHVEELSQLNDYCKAMHHGETFAGASSTVADEARNYVQRAIAFAQRRPEPA